MSVRDACRCRPKGRRAASEHDAEWPEGYGAVSCLAARRPSPTARPDRTAAALQPLSSTKKEPSPDRLEAVAEAVSLAGAADRPEQRALLSRRGRAPPPVDKKRPLASEGAGEAKRVSREHRPSVDLQSAALGYLEKPSPRTERGASEVRGHIHKRGSTWTAVYDEGSTSTAVAVSAPRAAFLPAARRRRSSQRFWRASATAPMRNPRSRRSATI